MLCAYDSGHYTRFVGIENWSLENGEEALLARCADKEERREYHNPQTTVTQEPGSPEQDFNTENVLGRGDC